MLGYYFLFRPRSVPSEVLLLLLLLNVFCGLHRQVNALTLPAAIRVDKNGNPRLATLAGKAVGVGTRIALLARSADNISVTIQAASNRQFLRGNLDVLEIDVENTRGPLLQLTELCVRGSSISLGWWPLVLTSLPFLWLRLRPPLLLLLLSYGLYRSSTYQKQQLSNNNNRDASTSPPPPSLLSRMRQRLDGSPCSVDYQVTISHDDMVQSKLLTLGLQSVLRSLMLNSVLGVAAAVGDTMTAVQNEMDEINELSKSASKSAMKNAAAASIINPLQLKPSTDIVSTSNGNNNDSKETTPSPPLGSTSNEDEEQETERRLNNRKEPMLSKLLEATDFCLTNTTFAKDGCLIMDADAILNENARLSFNLRVSLQPTTLPLVGADGQQMQKQQHALAFASPSCRFATGAVVGGGMLERFIPELWIPVGPGVAIPLGPRHRIQKVTTTTTTTTKNTQDDGKSCQIKGRLSFFQKEKEESLLAGLGSRLRDSFQQQTQPPPLPFSTKRQRRKNSQPPKPLLPPAKD